MISSEIYKFPYNGRQSSKSIYLSDHIFQKINSNWGKYKITSVLIKTKKVIIISLTITFSELNSEFKKNLDFNPKIFSSSDNIERTFNGYSSLRESSIFFNPRNQRLIFNLKGGANSLETEKLIECLKQKSLKNNKSINKLISQCFSYLEPLLSNQKFWRVVRVASSPYQLESSIDHLSEIPDLFYQQPIETDKSVDYEEIYRFEVSQGVNKPFAIRTKSHEASRIKSSSIVNSDKIPQIHGNKEIIKDSKVETDFNIGEIGTLKWPKIQQVNGFRPIMRAGLPPISARYLRGLALGAPNDDDWLPQPTSKQFERLTNAPISVPTVAMDRNLRQILESSPILDLQRLVQLPPTDLPTEHMEEIHSTGNFVTLADLAKTQRRRSDPFTQREGSQIPSLSRYKHLSDHIFLVGDPQAFYKGKKHESQYTNARVVSDDAQLLASYKGRTFSILDSERTVAMIKSAVNKRFPIISFELDDSIATFENIPGTKIHYYISTYQLKSDALEDYKKTGNLGQNPWYHKLQNRVRKEMKLENYKQELAENYENESSTALKSSKDYKKSVMDNKSIRKAEDLLKKGFTKGDYNRLSKDYKLLKRYQNRFEFIKKYNQESGRLPKDDYIKSKYLEKAEQLRLNQETDFEDQL